MLLNHNDLTIRTATTEDAPQLAAWWNDGKVMAHAGFPNGIGTTPEEVAGQISADPTGHRLVIELDGRLIGETSWGMDQPEVAEIGIKICDASQQERGLGRQVLSMLIRWLFEEQGAQKVVLDTNLKNTRAQHVYELLGFQKVGLAENSWKDQLGVLQSTVYYELLPENFRDFAK